MKTTMSTARSVGTGGTSVVVVGRTVVTESVATVMGEATAAAVATTEATAVFPQKNGAPKGA